MEHWYDLNGGMLRIEAPDEGLVAPLSVYLDELRSGPARTGHCFRLLIERCGSNEVATPTGAQTLFEGPLPEAAACVLNATAEGRQLIIPEQLSLVILPKERAARMRVAPGHEGLAGGSAGLMAIDSALSSCGQNLVHGAALRVRGRNQAIVLWAPSGAGKTTASLALALQGFGLLTDDATVLASKAGPTRVWGLPRPLKVHKRTAEMLPAIGALLGGTWNSEGEQALSRPKLRGTIELPPPRPLEVAAMVVVGPRVQGQHVIRPLPKAEVLVKLADNNVGRAVHGVLNDELARYQNLARAVATTPAFELNVGSELATLGEAFLTALS